MTRNQLHQLKFGNPTEVTVQQTRRIHREIKLCWQYQTPSVSEEVQKEVGHS